MNTLILIPTQLEADKLQLALTGNESRIDLAVCGFGPVGSAVGTCLLIERNQPDRVVLAGIAGALGKTAEIGQAYAFRSVTMHGIGIAQDGHLLSAAEVGFAELPLTPNSKDSIQDGSITLQTSVRVSSLPQLLTVCTSADGFEAASRRRKLFPAAASEDMEGYAVALACAAKGVPLMIIRGISNRAGEADRSQWQIEKSLGQTRAAILRAAAADDWGIS